ncbi:MAG: histidine kinase, partial [Daejeonella sp.]|uniref:histidine kinase n=1 Tax=Daejeonella sp. TaxID=2805397 RepID=UPI003C7558F4
MADYVKLLIYLTLEMVLYYGANVAINEFLVYSEIPVNIVDTYSKLFFLATLYRFIYIAGLSTAFHIALNLLKSQRRNHHIATEKLIAEKENESLRTELVSAQLSLLRSRVNPHFLFNTLNSVYNRIRKNDPNSAEYVMALAELMRYAFQPEAAGDEVPLEDELEHIS